MKTCYFCKGIVEEKKVEHIHRWEGEIFIFEDVEAEVCSQCGEVFFKPESLKMMDDSIKEKKQPFKSISVPVISLAV